MEKRVDNLSHITESIYSQQYGLCEEEQVFTKSADAYSMHQQRFFSQEYPPTELKPHPVRHRRDERYKSNIRRNHWPHVIQQDMGLDGPSSPPPSPYSSSKVASSISPYGTTHHKLTISTSLTPPTSPRVQELWPSSPTAEHQGMEQHLFYSTASSMTCQTRSQPDPSNGGSSSAKIVRSNAVKKRNSPISKIAILRRRSVTELTKHPTKSKLLTRKISYGGQPLSQELSFSSSKSKQNQGWSFNV